ncbi:MAG: hypothetical protein FP814_00315 [Desulfobacterium sp.]|nr:hypothetical protein [Desulfobacterium sp.]MBU3949690.1 hypothetical protein [Pseudomonadota bacterium]MBU4035418.1 hypothetical protein [Pseudomonadota bacterium]
MKQFSIFKLLTVFIIMSFMGTYAYGEATSQTDPLELVSSSKHYGQLTKVQAAEIIEKCASKTYKTKSIVEEEKFFMGVPSQTYPDSSGIRTTTKFKWADVKHIQLLQKSIKLTYAHSFFGTKQDQSLELVPQTYDLADLALAVVTITGLPLTREKAVPDVSDAAALENPIITGEQMRSSGKEKGAAQSTADRKTNSDLEESLIKLKAFYNKGLISEAIYESKQKELLDSMLGQ